jgi:hypothetical protein
MNANPGGGARDGGPHQHAHAAPTTEQIRTVGRRRRDAEQKLEHHLEEARHKIEPHDETDPEAGDNEGA